MPNGNDHVYVTRKTTAGLTDQQKQELQQQQQRSDYTKALKQFDDSTMELLQHHRTSIFGKQKEDSHDMLQVKQNMLALSLNMHEPIPFTTNMEQVSADFNTLLRSYDDSIAACEQYLKTHKNPFTSEGKARLAMVNHLYSMVKNDRKMIPDCARRLYEKAKENPNEQIVWGNLLHEARSVNLRTDLREHRDIGGGTSRVYRLEKDGTAAYFKQNEKRPSSDYEAMAKKWLQTQAEQDPALAETAGKMIAWVENDMNMIFNPVLTNIAMAMRRLDIPYNGTTALTEQQKTALLADVDVQQAITNIRNYSQMDVENDFSFIVRAAMALGKLETLAHTSGIAKIAEDRSISQRNVAASRMAKLMGMGDLLAESHRATILDTHTQNRLEGIVMKEVQGTSFNRVFNNARRSGEQVRYTPEALRQLSNLQILDTICGQVDRNRGNYLVQTEKNGNMTFITSITGIDNDMAFGMLSFDQVKYGVNELNAIEHKTTKRCNLPCIDRAIYDRLQALQLNELQFFLQDVLKPEEINALWQRCQGLLTLLNKTHTINEAERNMAVTLGKPKDAPRPFLLSREQWADECYRYGEMQGVAKELSYAAKEFIPPNPHIPIIEDNM